MDLYSAAILGPFQALWSASGVLGPFPRRQSPFLINLAGDQNITKRNLPDKTQALVSVLGLSVSIKWPPRYPHTNLPRPTNLGHPVRMDKSFPV